MPTFDPLRWIDDELAALEQQGLRRRRQVRWGPQTVTVTVDGCQLVNFGANDYLGLAADGRLAAAVAEALTTTSWGSGASPLITGYHRLHQELERRLAEFEGTEAALLFPSGFAANTGAVAALVGPGDTVYTDRKNHASLLDGCRLSRADVRVYAHNDMDQLRSLLDGGRGRGRRLIVSDSLFSMDGDVASLLDLADLADRYEAMLLVDEAHATGVFGEHGRGLVEHFGLEARVPVRVGTLSKALGSVGGFVAGSSKLIEWLIQRARPYVFSTATPAAMVAAALAALQIVHDEPHRRRGLLQQAEQLRAALVADGWDIGRSTTQIIPLMLGTPQRASELSQRLRHRGWLVPAIRPPTVPEGEACLRISLSYAHTPPMISGLREALRAERKEGPS